MTSEAIQSSIVQTGLGLGAGALLESIMPMHNEDASATTLVFETAVQMSLNSVAIVSLGSYLAESDPTYGIPFATALIEAQPELMLRLRAVSDMIKTHVLGYAQRMAGLPPVERKASS
tara:strand:+ start:1435 stop:1788 length:354 start_codon:yes stop_codon:yes gene_type:complete